MFIQDISFVNTRHERLQRRFLRADAVRRNSEISDNAGTYIAPRPSKMKTINYTTAGRNTILPTTPMLNQQTVSLQANALASVLPTRRFNPEEEHYTAVQRQNAKWQKSYTGHRIFNGQFWLFVYAAPVRMPNNSTDSLLYGCPVYRVPEHCCFIAQTADVRRYMTCSRAHRMDTLYIIPACW